MNRLWSQKLQRTRALWIVCALLSLMVASPAYAWEFDEVTGTLNLTGDVRWDADSAELPEGLILTPYDTDFEPKELADEDFGEEGALEGQGVYRFGGETSFATLSFGGLKERFTGRRVELRVWSRAQGTTFSGRVYWYANADGQDINEQPEQRNYMGGVVLQPTGRATDDGWQEWTTGPFDWDAAGAAPRGMTLQDTQFSGSGFLQANLAHRVEIDAFEIEDLGPAAVEAVSCNGATSDSVCGDVGACLWGTCVDSVLLSGPVPSELLRADYLERRTSQYEVFAGGIYSQSVMGELRESFAQLNDVTSPIVFWDTMRLAVTRLRDGHANAPAVDYQGGGNTGICLLMGEADLLPEGGIFPMVGSLRVWEDRLQVGDMLVAIDGMDPFEWVDQAPAAPRHYGDPVVREFTLVSSLMRHAAQMGSTLTFQRCTPSEEGGVCSAEDVEEITLDLGAELGERPGVDGVPTWVGVQTPCDGRFRRWVDDPEVTRYSFAGGTVQDDIGYLLINGTPAPNGTWRNSIMNTFDEDPAKGWILDERLGQGGVIDGVTFLTGYFLDPLSTIVVDMFPYYEDGLSSERYLNIVKCLNAGGNALPSCTGAIQWDLFDRHPNPGVHQDDRIAVLIGLDVSGNDYLTQLLMMRGESTRIFGSQATWGAFGTLTSLPAHLSEVYGGAIQITDSFFLNAPHETGQEFEAWTTGTGVPADEVIHQRQSDALRGEDTVLKRAQEWLEEADQ